MTLRRCVRRAWLRNPQRPEPSREKSWVNRHGNPFLFLSCLHFSFKLLDSGPGGILRDLCWVFWSHVLNECCHVHRGNGADLREERQKEQPDPAGRGLTEPAQCGQPDISVGHDMGFCLLCLGTLIYPLHVPLLHLQFITR